MDAFELWEGDCLELMKRIPTGSVDMILCDPPYGTTECKWDTVLDLAILWGHYERVIKDSGAIVIFANQPFTAALVSSNLKLFRYPLIWKRSRVTRHAQANYRPLSEHEDIIVFSKGKCSDNSTVKMTYYPQGVVEIEPKVSQYKAHSLRPGRATKTKVQTRTNFPRSILEFASDARPVHPTQKPVGLLEYLIRTYTNEGDTVLDNTMGSGSTGVACRNTGRKFIGIEKDPKYFEIAKKRIFTEFPEFKKQMDLKDLK